MGVSASVLVNMHVCTRVCWFICLGCTSFVCKRGVETKKYTKPQFTCSRLSIICVYIFIHVCMHVCIYVYYTYIYIYIYIYVYGRC